MAIEVSAGWVRLTHDNGAFVGAYDWRRGIFMAVNRGGTVYFDLAEIARQQEQEQQAQPTQKGE